MEEFGGEKNKKSPWNFFSFIGEALSYFIIIILYEYSLVFIKLFVLTLYQ